MTETKTKPKLAVPPSRLPFYSIGVTLLVLFLVIIGTIGLVWWQTPLLEQSTELRGDASVANGVVILTTSPPPNTTLTVNAPAKIDININTQGQSTKEIELVFHVLTGTIDTLNLQTYSTYNLEVTQQEIEATNDGFLVLYKARAANNGTFTTNSAQPVLSLLFTPNKSGTFKLAFDTEQSSVWKVNSAAPEDVLRTVGTFEYTVKDNPDQFAKTCNEPCNTNSECAVNHMCFEKRCRLVTNVSSASCTAPATADAGRVCNESCGSNSDCRSGLTCHESRCRRPDNPDSATCALSSAEQQAAIASNCNQGCTDNRGCAANLRCYQGQCRLASNTSSTSCSPATAPTVSSEYYPPKGGVIATPSPVATGSSRPVPVGTLSGVLATPSPMSTASASPLTSPYVLPSPQTEPSLTPAQQAGLLASLQNVFLNATSTTGNLLMVIIAVGAGLLLLALLLLLLRGRSSGSKTTIPKAPPTGSKSAGPGPGYEQELQNKINELKQKPGAPSTPTAVPPVGGSPSTTKASGDLPPAPTLRPASVATQSPAPSQAPKPVTSSITPAQPVSPAPAVVSPIASSPSPVIKPVTSPAPSTRPPAPSPKPTSVPTPAPSKPAAPAPKPASAPTPVAPKPAPKPAAQPKLPPRPTFTPPKPQSSLPSKPAVSALPPKPATPTLPPTPSTPALPARPNEAQLPPRSALSPVPASVKTTPSAQPSTSAPKTSTNGSSMMDRIKRRGITPPGSEDTK